MSAVGTTCTSPPLLPPQTRPQSAITLVVYENLLKALGDESSALVASSGSGSSSRQAGGGGGAPGAGGTPPPSSERRSLTDDMRALVIAADSQAEN